MHRLNRNPIKVRFVFLANPAWTLNPFQKAVHKRGNSLVRHQMLNLIAPYLPQHLDVAFTSFTERKMLSRRSMSVIATMPEFRPLLRT